MVIDADTLLGLNDMPAELVGYGPITAEHARALAIRSDATWRRMITDLVSGTVLDIGHRRYKPPAALADHIRADHPTCAFPGCRMPAEACDLDHVIPFDPDDPEGVTASTNLRPDCRPHHLLKTLAGWTCRTRSASTTTWTSPTGHRYRTRHTPLIDPTDRPQESTNVEDVTEPDGADTSRSDGPDTSNACCSNADSPSADGFRTPDSTETIEIMTASAADLPPF